MRRRRREDGFTLIELLFTVVIMGVITVPLGNFMLSYLRNFQTTQNRVSDSHDIQIATAFFSQDAANTGVHVYPAPACTAPFTSCYPLQQSSWPAGSSHLPASYCGQTTGTLVLLLEWDTWTLSAAGPAFTGTAGPINSVAYVTVGTTLHRVYCQPAAGAGHVATSTTTSDSIVVHNLRSATPICPDSTGSAAQCDTSTPPVAFSISLTISGTTGTNVDQAAPTHAVVLTGQRRQT